MTATESAQAALHVLLIEDNQDHAYLIGHAISETWPDAAFHHVVGAQAAMEHLRDPQHAMPDLILLDLKMPGPDGFDFLSAIKVNSQWRRIPVVVLTTSLSPEDRDRAYDLHANSFVVKPVDGAGFRKMIAELHQYWNGLNQRMGSKPARLPSPRWQ